MDITYVKAVFGGLRKTTTTPIFRDDHDLILRLVGVRGLPEYFQAHFANQEYGTAIVKLGHDGDVIIPNALIATGLPVFCWVIVENDISGRVIYTAKIPVRQKARPDGTIPPEQADIISQAISALNDAGDSAREYAESAQQSAEEAAQSAEYITETKADLDDAIERVGVLEQAKESTLEAAGNAEAWAVGNRDGSAVPSTDPAYHNNAKYYAEQAAESARTLTIDSTLSKSGQAADAKVTGDEISELKESLSDAKADLSAEDVTVNDALSYVNYGYDTPFYKDIDGINYWAIFGVKRNKQVVVLNKQQTANTNVRIRLSGEVAYAGTNAAVDAWTSGFALIAGHEYQVVSRLIEGSVSVNDVVSSYSPTIYVYKAGEHSSIGDEGERTGNVFRRTFTAEANTQYNIVMYILNATEKYTNAKFLITLEDLTISARKKIEDDITQINSNIIDINDELNTRLSLSIDDITDITTGTDYNTIINAGNYAARTGSRAATMINSPTTAAHRLIVSSLTAAARIFQIVITYNNDIFFRTKSSGDNTDLSTGWTAWNKVADVNTIEAEIAELKPDSLPDYYFTDDYIDDRMSTILTNRRTIGTPSVEFAFFTDPHFYDGTISKVQNGMQHIGLLSYLRRKTNITDIICGGDLENDNSMTVAECLALFSGVRKYLDPLWDHLFMIIGNHEWNNPGLATAQEVNEMTFNQLYTHWLADKSRKFEGLDKECGSYYFDDTINKVRYIMLGTNKGGNITFNQFKWIRNTMLSTPDGYTVICTSHISLTGELAYIGRFGEVVNLLDAAKTKGTWSYTYPGTSNPLTADFTNKNIDVACVISGHIHRDLSVYSTGGIPVVTTVCDCGPRSTTSEAFNEARAYGTTNEQAIDVCQIDLQNKKIYMTRIGGSFDGTAPLQNPDREFTF